jgi:hypothetical protein
MAIQPKKFKMEDFGIRSFSPIEINGGTWSKVFHNRGFISMYGKVEV